MDRRDFLRAAGGTGAAVFAGVCSGGVPTQEDTYGTDTFTLDENTVLIFDGFKIAVGEVYRSLDQAREEIALENDLSTETADGLVAEVAFSRNDNCAITGLASPKRKYPPVSLHGEVKAELEVTDMTADGDVRLSVSKSPAADQEPGFDEPNIESLDFEEFYRESCLC